MAARVLLTPPGSDAILSIDNIYIFYMTPRREPAASLQEARRTVSRASKSAREGAGRKLLRSFTATSREIEMLEAIAAYHGFSKSGTITNLVKKRRNSGGSSPGEPRESVPIPERGSWRGPMPTEVAVRIAPPPWASIDEEEALHLRRRIRALAAQKGTMILAHNYQLPEVQDAADFVGDSLGLSLQAQKDARMSIVFCGVHFMAESAKILNPEKKVFLPSLAAGCSLADSITPESLEDWKRRYPRHTVVTYINSSAEVKALSDLCCTSANAVSVIRSLPSKRILFTPDRNLGRWVARQVPEKEIVVYDGCCPTHDVLRGTSLEAGKRAHPGAVVIAHPECREDVLALADEICSTTGMMAAVARHPEARTFLIATEWGLIHQLKKRYPDREFIPADGCIGCRLHCPYMKMNDLESVLRSLQEDLFEVRVDAETAAGARRALERMLEVPRDR
jgi:quinolinate synthase